MGGGGDLWNIRQIMLRVYLIGTLNICSVQFWVVNLWNGQDLRGSGCAVSDVIYWPLAWGAEENQGSPVRMGKIQTGAF
jgi:hypothetical protein